MAAGESPLPAHADPDSLLAEQAAQADDGACGLADILTSDEAYAFPTVLSRDSSPTPGSIFTARSRQQAQRTANALSLRFLQMPIAEMASAHAARNADIVSAAVVPNRAGFLVVGLVLSLAISAVRRWPGQASR